MAVQDFYFFGSYNAFRPFILTVDSGADARYTIPTAGTGYNYSVNTSDGQFFNGVTGNQLIVFPLANTLYDIEITGLFPHFYVNYNGEAYKLKDIKQWGDIVWKSFLFAFYGCGAFVNPITAIDSPILSLATNLGAIAVVSNFNANVSSWDTSSVVNIGSAFQENNAFNQDVSSWNVSQVTMIQQVFDRATAMAQPVDWSNPTTGTINVTNTIRAFDSTKIPSIKLQCGNVTSVEYRDFYNNLFLTELILIDLKVSRSINTNPLLVGIGIDNLANSVADRTGFASPTITMTVAQKASCNISLWSAKNWTIATV